MKPTTNLWAIRAGKSGKADNLFFATPVIAIEDDSLRDLCKLEASREAFKRAYMLKHPESTPSGGANIAGKFFRFVHENKNSDLVIYYRLVDRHFYIAKVTGAYTYEPSSKFPHQRSVRWKCRFPKEALSYSAQRELGAARTFFGVTRHRDEILEVIQAADAFKREFVLA